MSKTSPTTFPTPEALAEWVKSTCLTFGTTIATAYEVSGLFVKGLPRPVCPRCHGWADEPGVAHDMRGCYVMIAPEDATSGPSNGPAAVSSSGDAFGSKETS